MQFSSKFTILFMACITLAGCAGNMPWDKKKAYKANVAPVTITDKPSASGSSAGQAYPLNGNDLQSMVSTSSGGSVEIYNLDSGRPYGGSGETISRVPLGSSPFDGGGAPLPSDPSVTVYPLDGSDLHAALPQMGGGYMPIPGQPVGGEMGLYNTGSISQGIDGGKNAPRTGGPVSSVYFGYGSSDISGDDRNALRSVAESAKFAPVDRVVVEGYASPQTQTDDPVESRILNLRESLKRAGKVAETLIEDGVPAEKIKTVGWGDTKQGMGSESEQRRVDIVTGPGAGF